jgi:hypothetical protein
VLRADLSSSICVSKAARSVGKATSVLPSIVYLGVGDVQVASLSRESYSKRLPGGLSRRGLTALSRDQTEQSTAVGL